MKKEWINPTISMLGASQTKFDDTLFVDDGDERAVDCMKCGHHHKPSKPCQPSNPPANNS